MKMNKLLSALLAGVFVLVVSGCSTTNNNETTRESRIRAVANAFVLTQYPDFDIKDKVLVIKDKGDAWEVYYELSVTMLGGSPVVIVSKNSEKVISSYRYQ